ncbi:hypothetical protein JHK85_004088 [Glycine max]|nr:hypothetical protein JHK85_004088 [Glycine max]
MSLNDYLQEKAINIRVLGKLRRMFEQSFPGTPSEICYVALVHLALHEGQDLEQYRLAAPYLALTQVHVRLENSIIQHLLNTWLCPIKDDVVLVEPQPRGVRSSFSNGRIEGEIDLYSLGSKFILEQK